MTLDPAGLVEPPRPASHLPRPVAVLERAAGSVVRLGRHTCSPLRLRSTVSGARGPPRPDLVADGYGALLDPNGRMMVDHDTTMRSAYERINAGDIAGFGVCSGFG